MFSKILDIPVFYSDEKLLKHIEQSRDMDTEEYLYDDTTRISYDNELIPLNDASTRLTYDRARERMYDWAEDQVEADQMTFEDVKEKLEDPPQLTKTEWRKL